jgi:hypothetical protein
MERVTRSPGPTPDQLAEAPLNDATHPAVVERITKEMWATARVLDASTAQAFAADEPWKALQFLRQSVETLAAEAELHRPDHNGVVWAATSA